MKEINKLFESSMGYFRTIPDFQYLFGLFLGHLIFLYVVAIFVLKIDKRKISPKLKLYTAIYISILFNLFSLVGYSTYFTFFNSQIFRLKLQGEIILIAIGLLFLTFFIFKKLYKESKGSGISLWGVNSGPFQMSSSRINFQGMVTKMRRYSLVVLVPFILLLFSPNQRYLYSIIFDNSSSMDQQIDFAKEELSNLVVNLKDNSTFIVSRFPQCKDEKDCNNIILKSKMNLNEIVKTSDPSTLIPITTIYETKKDFEENIQNGILDISEVGSPIYEAIWQNFSNSIKVNSNINYTKRKLIILTDGADNLYSGVKGFISPNSCISEFSKENVTIDNFYETKTILIYNQIESNNIINNCSSFDVLDGSNSESFKSAFTNQLVDIYFDKDFLFILSFIIIMGISFIYILK
jgi:hypothetical protein